MIGEHPAAAKLERLVTPATSMQGILHMLMNLRGSGHKGAIEMTTLRARENTVLGRKKKDGRCKASAVHRKCDSRFSLCYLRSEQIREQRLTFIVASESLGYFSDCDRAAAV